MARLKLTPAAVAEIRRALDPAQNWDGFWSQAKMARRFGVSEAMVSTIVKGKRW